MQDGPLIQNTVMWMELGYVKQKIHISTYVELIMQAIKTFIFKQRRLASLSGSN